ncbi:MAG: hypothetical protein AABW90_01770 [Nanoarchaeota archaeon]
MIEEEKFLDAVRKIKEQENKRDKKRNFDQTIDLIVNLKDFDAKKSSFTIFVEVPNKIKDKKIVGFFEKENKLVEVIKKDDFLKFKEKKDIKKLIRSYDFFIANAKLMPAIATTFGRILGPVGKMPNPQLGVLNSEDENSIKEVVDKINFSIRIKVKEPSIKIGIAKESLNDEQIVENALIVYRKIVDALPKKIDNIRNVKIKLTMAKPVNVELK